MVLWMFAFYNVERLHAPLDFASFVYPLATAAALAVLVIPGAARVATPLLTGAALACYAVLKAMQPRPIFGEALPVTVTELSSIVLSVALAAKLAREHAAFESSLGFALLEHLEHRCAPFEIGQAQMVQEMRRARRFERPVVALSVAPAEGRAEVSMDELFVRVQRENLEHYVLASVGRILTEETDGAGILTQRGDHFVALLPEATGDDAEALARRIEREVGEQLGLRLRIGKASFPDQEVTLDALVQRSEREMRRHEPSLGAVATAERANRGARGGRGVAVAERGRQPASSEKADAVGDAAQGAA
jgi:hypothetical protein